MTDRSFEILKWPDISQNIASLNPELYKEICKIPNVSEFGVLKVRYPYAAKIIEKGQLYLNLDGKMVPYHQDSNIPEAIRSMLDYDWQGIPFGIVLKNSAESYIDSLSHNVPLRLLTPGNTFSLLTIFKNPYFANALRSLVAGCRSLLMLSKLSEKQANERIKKKYQIDYSDPKDYNQHFEMFQSITNNKQKSTPWHTELLFFSRDFVHAIDDTLPFRHKILESVWALTGFTRNLNTIEFLWSDVLHQIKTEGILSNAVLQDPYIVETAKHLIRIACRELPGYRPVTTDLAAPISFLNKVFVEDYRLRWHYPVFMRLSHLTKEEPVYYTLQHHTSSCHLPQLSYKRKTVEDLCHIKTIVDFFKSYVLDGKCEHPLEDSELYNTLKHCLFDFYHPKGPKGIITDIFSLTKSDNRFINHDVLKKNNQLKFPDASLFFHGCVRIKSSD